MNRRPTLLAAITLTAAAALTLSACGGSDSDSSKDNDKIAGADTGDSRPRRRRARARRNRRAPKIELPSDLKYTFEWSKTGDEDKDAVLADAEQSIQAVDMAIANQDPLDKAYLYYYEGEAAAQTEQYIKEYVEAKARTTGRTRYYNATVDVRDDGSASLCTARTKSKAYNMYLKPKKVDKTAVTKTAMSSTPSRCARTTKASGPSRSSTRSGGVQSASPDTAVDQSPARFGLTARSLAVATPALPRRDSAGQLRPDEPGCQRRRRHLSPAGVVVFDRSKNGTGESTGPVTTTAPTGPRRPAGMPRSTRPSSSRRRWSRSGSPESTGGRVGRRAAQAVRQRRSVQGLQQGQDRRGLFLGLVCQRGLPTRLGQVHEDHFWVDEGDAAARQHRERRHPRDPRQSSRTRKSRCPAPR